MVFGVTNIMNSRHGVSTEERLSKRGCTCGHLQDDHETGLDYGYHKWKCTKCGCPWYVSVREFIRDWKEGMFDHKRLESVLELGIKLPKVREQ